MQLIDFLTLKQFSHNIGNKVEGVGQKIYAINFNHIKTILWVTEGETWKERKKYKKHEKQINV